MFSMYGVSTPLDPDVLQAFPSLSTGIFGYPIEDATHIALDATRLFLDTAEGDKVVDHSLDGGEDTDRSLA